MNAILKYGERIMHIDVSGRYYEKRDSGIAYKIIKTDEHKGLVLSNKLKRELDRDIKLYQNYEKLHAICIYSLIESSLDDFDTLVICGDEEFDPVKFYLDILFKGNNEYRKKKIMSIAELREITGNPKLKSYADSAANIYRKKARKPLYRQQKGVPLNIVHLNYAKITELWNKIGSLKFKRKT